MNPILPPDEPSVRSKTVIGNRNPDWLGTVDQFAVLRKLGSGGFGTVYLAEDSFTKVKYALKTILPELKSSSEEMERLKEKFTLVQRLHHPHVAGAYELHLARDVEFASEEVAKDLRLVPGDPVMVMRYAPGETLSAWRRQFPGGRVPPDKAAAVCRQVAEALDYAHSERVLHRDIKPGNISVEEKDGVLGVQVLDFGLAEQIRTSLSRTSRARYDGTGTRPYMAPEQWVGKKQEGPTDQYALAVVLYELVSGDVPFGYAFSTGDIALMEHKALHEPVLSIPDLSETQNRALRKALSKEAADRFPSCQAFLDAFEGRFTFADAVGGGAGGSAQAGPVTLGGAFRRSIRQLGPFFRAVAQRVGDALRPAWDRFWKFSSPPFYRLRDRLWPSLGKHTGPASSPGGTGPATARGVRDPASSPTVFDHTPGPPPVITPVDLGNGLSFEMAELPSGAFFMGSPHSEAGRRPGETLHEVRIATPFQIAVAPVTRGKWRAVMGREPPGHDAPDDHPVVNVSWDDAHTFLDTLNRDHPIPGREWRLPTEAQWEYACRAGSSAPYAGTGLVDEMGWYSGNCSGSAQSVRQKKPNAWGLYDMHGNVLEWCEDAWSESLGQAPATNPFVPGTDRDRVTRGGAWNYSAALCRSACRMKMPRSAHFDNVGFRVALVQR